MARVQIVTDSACDLTDQLADDNGIVIVPLSVRFGDEELVDRRDLDRSRFLEALRDEPHPSGHGRSPTGRVPVRLRGRSRRRL